MVSVAEDLPILSADLALGVEAVEALVAHALESGAGEGPPVVEVAPYRGPEGLGLIVADRGPGIAIEDAERIFGLFAQGGRQGASLAVVRQAAERHGGAAWVQPRPGGGSEFVLVLGPPGA